MGNGLFSKDYINRTLGRDNKEGAMLEVMKHMEEEMRKQLKARGVNIPADVPLARVREFCHDNCHDVCYGPYGISAHTKLNMREVCGIQIAESSRQAQTGNVMTHLGASITKSIQEGITGIPA